MIRPQVADEAAKRILANITATMSDRASTEKKFNSLLEELRTSILADLNSNWDELSTKRSGCSKYYFELLQWPSRVSLLCRVCQ